MKATTNRKVLEGLPHRNWQLTTTYPSLLIVPSGKKHDSGYHLIAIVGCNEKSEPIEIAGMCDDIEVKIKDLPPTYGPNGEYSLDTFRVDMSYPSGITRWWGAYFTVGESLSSTVVTVAYRDRRSTAVKETTP